MLFPHFVKALGNGGVGEHPEIDVVVFQTSAVTKQVPQQGWGGDPHQQRYTINNLKVSFPKKAHRRIEDVTCLLQMPFVFSKGQGHIQRIAQENCLETLDIHIQIEPFLERFTRPGRTDGSLKPPWLYPVIPAVSNYGNHPSRFH